MPLRVVFTFNRIILNIIQNFKISARIIYAGVLTITSFISGTEKANISPIVFDLINF